MIFQQESVLTSATDLGQSGEQESSQVVLEAQPFSPLVFPRLSDVRPLHRHRTPAKRTAPVPFPMQQPFLHTACVEHVAAPLQLPPHLPLHKLRQTYRTLRRRLRPRKQTLPSVNKRPPLPPHHRPVLIPRHLLVATKGVLTSGSADIGQSGEQEMSQVFLEAQPFSPLVFPRLSDVRPRHHHRTPAKRTAPVPFPMQQPFLHTARMEHVAAPLQLPPHLPLHKLRQTYRTLRRRLRPRKQTLPSVNKRPPLPPHHRPVLIPRVGSPAPIQSHEKCQYTDPQSLR
nr:hypothetical protein Iba_chr01bCG18200 [Ipomoea batatas]